MKKRGLLMCVRTFEDGPHRAVALHTFVSVDHPMAAEYPERFRHVPGDRKGRADHRRLLLAAQARLNTSPPSSSGMWGVR